MIKVHLFSYSTNNNYSMYYPSMAEVEDFDIFSWLEDHFGSSALQNDIKKRKRKTPSENYKRKKDAQRKAYRLTRYAVFDIRRYFPTMIINCLNSSDINLTKRFFETYCTENSYVIDCSAVECTFYRSVFKPLLVAQGYNAMLKYCETLFQRSPDCIRTIHEVQIRTRYNSPTTILASYRYDGVITHKLKHTHKEVKMIELIDQGNFIQNSEGDLIAVGPHAEELAPMLKEQQQQKFDFHCEVEPVEMPTRLQVENCVILQLNDEGKITSIDAVSCMAAAESYMTSLCTPSWMQRRTTSMIHLNDPNFNQRKKH
jgi:hypothetical protein